MYETWFPLQHTCKEEFCEGCLNKTFDFEIGATSNVYKSRNKDPIMKLGLFGHNSLKYCAYLSSLWPCVIIPVKVMDNYLSLDIILLHTCNLRNIIFAWSILSWIMHRNSSFVALTLSSKYGISFYMIFGERYVFLTSLHTLEPHFYSFTIWISSPSRIHKQCILQTWTLTFAHWHSNDVFSSTYS